MTLGIRMQMEKKLVGITISIRTNETIKIFWKMYWWLGTSLIKQNLTYKLTCKSLVDITSFYLNFNIKESAALWNEREQLESLVSMHPSLHPASMWESSGTLAHFVILSSNNHPSLQLASKWKNTKLILVLMFNLSSLLK